MTSESEKGKIEIGIFKRFAQVVGIEFDSVSKQSPLEGKPDLKVTMNGEVVYFELTEACSEDLAKALASNQPSEDLLNSAVVDYTSKTYRKKLQKNYQVKEPIELLIYNVGRTILPDEVLIDNIKAISSKDKGPFRRVWYFGEHVSEL